MKPENSRRVRGRPSVRGVVAQRKRASAFRLRRASFKGDGLQAAFAGASWEQIRAAAYDKHGA